MERDNAKAENCFVVQDTRGHLHSKTERFQQRKRGQEGAQVQELEGHLPKLYIIPSVSITL